MNISGLENINSLQQSDGKPSTDQLKKAAVQFEAVLLMQLTSALNGTNDDDEDALFGSDAGSGLAKQLFSEQMATVMAQSGGMGISDLIMRQLSGQKAQAGTGGIKSLSEVISSIKPLKASENTPIKAEKRLIEERKTQLPTRTPETEKFAGDPNEVQIISTFEDDLRTNGIDDSLKNLILDGRVVNSTRARVVPNAPIVEVGKTVSNSIVSGVGEISFQRPAAGRISSEFGNRFHPIDKRTRFHGGLDIAVPTGTTVSAAAEGTVVFAGKKGGYGNLVIIQHPDGRETRYAHLSSFSVAAGDPVAKGEPIASSGSTGRSTGPHLHFEIRENGVAVDPERFLSNVLPRNAER
jgi:flagellar protein FlgJ